MLAVRGVLPHVQFSKFQAISGFATQCMAEHQAVPKAMSTERDKDEERTDFMTKLMARHHKYLAKYTELYARLGCLQNVAAGSDTTGATFKQTQDMPYLQAVIKEALRMHSATGLPLEMIVPEGNSMVEGSGRRGGQ